MKILENKQYTFNFEFDFASGIKSIKCHLFIFDKKIQVVSFVGQDRFVKLSYDLQSKELISFDNYYNKLISLSGKQINDITENISKAMKLSSKIENFNVDLITIFDLNVTPFSIEREKVRFSLVQNNESNLSKTVHFRSGYAKSLSKDSILKLILLKDKQIYHYCIEDNNNNPICKFTFNLEESISKNFLKLTNRVNYIKEASTINFEILNNDFNQINSTLEEMHIDVADEKIKFVDSNNYSYFYMIFDFKNIKPLPLSI